VRLFKEGKTGDKFHSALSQANYTVQYSPVLSFAYINAEALKNALERANAYSGMVVTSSRAFTALRNLFPDEATLQHLCGPWLTKPLFVVGKSTLSKAPVKFKNITQGPAGSIELSKLIVAKVKCKEESLPLLYLCSSIRRNELPDALALEGIKLAELVVYETVGIDINLEDQSDKPCWVVFFSPSGVKAVLSKYPPSSKMWTDIKFVRFILFFLFCFCTSI